LNVSSFAHFVGSEHLVYVSQARLPSPGAITLSTLLRSLVERFLPTVHLVEALEKAQRFLLSRVDQIV